MDHNNLLIRKYNIFSTKFKHIQRTENTPFHHINAEQLTITDGDMASLR